MSASDDKEKCDSEREDDVVYETGIWAGLGIESAIGVGKAKGRKSRNRRGRRI